ncbi:MAG: SOS response-associated peptidase [Phycisphaerales bacterium]
MCGRFAQVFQLEDLDHIDRILKQAAGLDDDLIALFAENHCPSYNIPPSAHATIIHTQNIRNPFTQAHFGLIPSWAKDRSRAASMNNARSETITKKVSFRNLIRSSRCLVPTTGFYEWQSKPGTTTKQPWYIYRADGCPMFLAGIWDTWFDPEHGHCEVESFAIITTQANEMVSSIHHRMPAIIEPEDSTIWLDQHENPKHAQSLLESAADGILSMHPVSTRVNSSANDSADLIEEDKTLPPASLWG